MMNRLVNTETFDKVDPPAGCKVRYEVVWVDPDEDLDFVIKCKYGDVQYHIRRKLTYLEDTGRTEWCGILRVLQNSYKYELEIYETPKSHIDDHRLEWARKKQAALCAENIATWSKLNTKYL